MLTALREAARDVHKWERTPHAHRHRILGNPKPSTAYDRAYRQAWAEYIKAGTTCGLVDETMIRRLRDPDEDTFRGAIAECHAAWFLSTKQRLKVTPNPLGNERSVLDLKAEGPSGWFNVEVKAPHVPRLSGLQFGNDSKVLEATMQGAAKQLRSGQPNLVLIVPSIRVSAIDHRDQMLALVGQHGVEVFVDLSEDGTAEALPPPRAAFFQKGRLVRGLKKTPEGLMPGHTRVSAVAALEDDLVYGAPETRSRFLVIHNPFAEVPLPPEPFDPHPQFVRSGDSIHWRELQVSS